MSNRPALKAVYCADVPGAERWQGAPVYRLGFSKDRDGAPVEGGEVQMAWNEQGLYVAAQLDDSYSIAKDLRDEQLHFQTGDVFELFLKPLNDSYCWEMYVTPNGNKSTLFFPRRRNGMSTDDFLTGHNFRELEVSAYKSSSGWNAELFVPVSQLTAFGAEWGPGSEWTGFCGRYNYNNEALRDPELTMVPMLSKTNYRLTEEYAALEFLRD